MGPSSQSGHPQIPNLNLLRQSRDPAGPLQYSHSFPTMDRQPLQSLADSALNRLVGSPLRRGSPEDKADFDRENGPVRKRPRNDDDKRDIIRSDRVEDGVARVERLPKLPPSRSLPARLLHREIQGIPQIYRQTKCWSSCYLHFVFSGR